MKNTTLIKAVTVALGISALAISSLSHSAIITNAAGTYTHDTTTDFVVGGGLEWLQWDHSSVLGKSWNEVNSSKDSILGGGWSIASNVQMAALFNSFDFGRIFDENEATLQTRTQGVDLLTEGGEDLTFVKMFGDTYKAAGGVFDFGEGGYQASQAIFGNDLDGDGRINRALVHDDFISSDGRTLAGGVALYGDSLHKTTAANVRSVALVRRLSVSTPIPEPSVVGLMVTGLVGLGLVRRRKKQSESPPIF